MMVLDEEKLGLFTYNGQVSLASSKGPVGMQAQNGNMHLFTQTKLILALADDILFVGKASVKYAPY